MKKLSVEKVEFAKSLLRQGVSKRLIAAQIGVHHCTVSRIRAELKKDAEELPTVSTGRPRSLTERDARKLVRLVVSGTCSNGVQAKKKMEEDPTFPVVSDRTCRRVLRRAGYRGRVKLKKPLLKKTGLCLCQSTFQVDIGSMEACNMVGRKQIQRFWVRWSTVLLEKARGAD
jgi:transposase